MKPLALLLFSLLAFAAPAARRSIAADRVEPSGLSHK